MEITLANVKLQFIYMAFRLHGNVHELFNCSCCNKHRVNITGIGSNLTMGLVCPLSPHHPSHFHLHSALRHWTCLLGWHQHPLVWHIFGSTLKKNVKGKTELSSTEEDSVISISIINKHNRNQGRECNSINGKNGYVSFHQRLAGIIF